MTLDSAAAFAYTKRIKKVIGKKEINEVIVRAAGGLRIVAAVKALPTTQQTLLLAAYLSLRSARPATQVTITDVSSYYLFGPEVT